MDPKTDFIAEMDASKRHLGIDTFRVANNLSVKLCTLLESGAIDNIDVRRVRRSTPWSISTYEMTPGFGYTVEKDSWLERRGKIYRTTEKALLDYVSIDTRKLQICSIPGVSKILEDNYGYRLLMTHRDLFSDDSIKMGDWKGHGLLKINTEHMLDRSLEEAYWDYLTERDPGLPSPPQGSPSMTVGNAELVRWYRNLSGAHSAAEYPQQLIGENFLPGKFFVRPLLSSRKEYFRAVLGMQPMRKLIASLVFLLACEVYVALANQRSNAHIFADVPKLVSPDFEDVTTMKPALATYGEVANDMIRHVDNFDIFVDKRYNKHLFEMRDTPEPNRVVMSGQAVWWDMPTNLYKNVFETFKRHGVTPSPKAYFCTGHNPERVLART